MTSKVLSRGWLRAIIHGTFVALIIAALGEVVSLLLYVTDVIPGQTLAQAARQGLILFYVFHHVALDIHTTALQLPASTNPVFPYPQGLEISGAFVFALLGGTAAALILLRSAGRSVGRGTGGSPFERALQGAKVAIPYAALSGAMSWYVELRQRMPGTSLLTIRPPHVGAFTWPLFFGIVMGAIGGFRSSDPVAIRDWLGWQMTEKWIFRWRGALAGAKRTFYLMLALAFAGVVMVAIAQPSSTSGFFEGLAQRGVEPAIAIGVIGLLALPNVALWALLPAMGGCLEVGGGVGGLNSNQPVPYCLLSYSNSLFHPLPHLSNDWGYAGYHELGAPSSWFLLFLLVPLIAAFVGGMRAARVGRASNAREAFVLTTLSALVLALVMLVAMMLAWITLSTSGPTVRAEEYTRYGPYPPDALPLAFSWGLVAGGMGGAFAAWRMKRAAARARGEPFVPQPRA